MAKERKVCFDPEYVRDISERVYRERLCDASGDGAVQRMVAKDGDGGQKLRGRAASYDVLSRAYLKALGFTPKAVP